MSDFLTLVQDLHREVGASGTTPPSAVTSQVGENQRLVKWVARADNLIQALWSDWKFLWSQTASTFQTVPSQSTLAAPSDINFWDFETFKIDGEPVEAIEYFSIRGEVLDTSEDIPSRVIVMPDNSLMFEPVPDTAYDVSADYYRKPTTLAANEDISSIPETYHDAILGRAIILYANYEGAPEMLRQGNELYNEELARLENHELPNLKHSRFKQGAHIEVIAS